MGRRKIYKAPPSLNVEAPIPSAYQPGTEWREPLTRVCTREVCKKEFIVTASHQHACPECQPLHHQERRHKYYINVELPNIDRVYELHAIARAKRHPPQMKDCVVAALYDKISRNEILTGRKGFSGKLGAVIVMVAALYDRIGGRAVLADAHAKCRKKFTAKHSAVTCSPECSDAWRVIYRLAYDETNRNEVNSDRRNKRATDTAWREATNKRRRKKRATNTEWDNKRRRDKAAAKMG
jgi:hypothetical protein